MLDEMIDVLTETGDYTGEIKPKSEIHRLGLYHNTGHIWFYTTDGAILLQQRSKKKLICPGLWDVSVAGHVDAGENIENAVIRETKEELGINISEKNLFKLGVFECFQSYDNGIVDNEFHHTFISELQVPISDINFQDDEVESVKLVTLIQFENLLANSSSNGHFVPSNKFYYHLVLEAVRTKLKTQM